MSCEHLGIGEWASGNVYIRPMRRNAGEVVEGHTHNFDHTTIFFRGRWNVRATLPDGRVIERQFQAPSHALIKAEVVHQLTALDDGSEAWCVYAHRTPQGEVVQEFNGWGDAYL